MEIRGVPFSLCRCVYPRSSRPAGGFAVPKQTGECVSLARMSSEFPGPENCPVSQDIVSIYPGTLPHSPALAHKSRFHGSQSPGPSLSLTCRCETPGSSGALASQLALWDTLKLRIFNSQRLAAGGKEAKSLRGPSARCRKVIWTGPSSARRVGGPDEVLVPVGTPPGPPCL